MNSDANNSEIVLSLATSDLIAETYLTEEGKTRLAVLEQGRVSDHPSYTWRGRSLSPLDARHSLIAHRVVLLPSAPVSALEHVEIFTAVRDFVRRHVTLSSVFLEIATAYVLLSWVYDAFEEVPYLRFRGDFGSGKTRALRVIGSLLYKPLFASGATTVSPLFHALDLFRGSLVLDEADFRFTDQSAELTKILNNGNARGMPVLRSVAGKGGNYEPRAFAVYGPKIIAMREFFRDAALESRCLSETMGLIAPANSVPLSLPKNFEEEATAIRGKLLTWRFSALRVIWPAGTLFPGLSHRGSQLIAPIIACLPDKTHVAAILDFVRAAERERQGDRARKPEAQVLAAILSLAQGRDLLALSAIRDELSSREDADFDRPLTPRYLGYLLRARLNLTTLPIGGVYHVQLKGAPLGALAARFGLTVPNREIIPEDA